MPRFDANMISCPQHCAGTNSPAHASIPYTPDSRVNFLSPWIRTHQKEVRFPHRHTPESTPLTNPHRAHKHPLSLPRRRLPTGPRLRHVLLLLRQRPPRPRPQAPLPNCARPIQRRHLRTLHREDTGPRCRKAIGGVRFRKRCTRRSEGACRAARTGESSGAVVRGDDFGEGGRDGGSVGAFE